MNYRIILLGSGLLMMFSVYGYVMMVGAIVGESDAVVGNFTMGTIFLVLTIVALQVGLRGRRTAHRRFEEVIASELTEFGLINAERFATALNVSLDDARDILAKKAQERNWSCTELGGYNAEYRPN